MSRSAARTFLVSQEKGKRNWTFHDDLPTVGQITGRETMKQYCCQQSPHAAKLDEHPSIPNKLARAWQHVDTGLQCGHDLLASSGHVVVQNVTLSYYARFRPFVRVQILGPHIIHSTPQAQPAAVEYRCDCIGLDITERTRPSFGVSYKRMGTEIDQSTETLQYETGLRRSPLTKISNSRHQQPTTERTRFSNVAYTQKKSLKFRSFAQQKCCTSKRKMSKLSVTDRKDTRQPRRLAACHELVAT